MGKATGFLDYEREDAKASSPKERIKNFNEFHEHLSEEKQKCQAARCMDCGVPFCQNGKVISGMVSGCPLNNLVPEWNDLLYHGNMEQAYNRLHKTNNFPEFTSRVCPALCEKACTCSLYGDAVSVRDNEYSIIENAYKEGYASAKTPSVRTGKKVAVIGSGPSGLAAADQLNKRGYQVTVFEREDRLGGLLMYGIPNMKLEKHIIDRRIELMEEEGVVFKTNAGIENRKQVQQLYKEFDRVILACGSKKARDIKAPGRDAKGIYFAVDYLTGITKSLLNSQLEDQTFVETKGKNVLVIGGGDTGNDCVGSAIRLGCKSVIQLEMMPEPPHERLDSNPWPEWPRVKKTDYGQNESIAVFGHDPRLYQTTVNEFIKDDKGNVKQVVIVSLESKQVEGRMQMVPVKGSEKTLDADIVLIAAGFVGCEDYVAKAFDVKLTPRGNVADENYQTNQKQLYVAGDMRRGQSLVVWAIREGREVARAVDEDLMGYSNL